MPIHFRPEAKNFIKQLLQPVEAKRLGNLGAGNVYCLYTPS